MRLLDRILQDALANYFPPGPFARLLNQAEAQGFNLTAPWDYPVGGFGRWSR